LPDWSKMNFKDYPAKDWSQILPSAEEQAVDLVKSLVVFESGWRLTAEDASRHAYLS
jgi:cyclin-dependent kinase